ncbi:MAG: cytochrome P450 [Acidimicrobiales bacterium]
MNALGLGILDFIVFADQWQRLRSEPGLAKNAFEEIVRLESPVVGFFRTVAQQAELAGATIPAESKVLVFFAGANRDPERWERPDEFDIGRRAIGHAGFGVGIHNCVGQVIARMEGEALFSAMTRHVGSIELVGEPTLRLNNTLRGLDAADSPPPCLSRVAPRGVGQAGLPTTVNRGAEVSRDRSHTTAHLKGNDS